MEFWRISLTGYGGWLSGIVVRIQLVTAMGVLWIAGLFWPPDGAKLDGHCTSHSNGCPLWMVSDHFGWMPTFQDIFFESQ